MNTFPLLTAAAAAMLALTACGGVSAASTSSAPAGSNQGGVSSAQAATAAPSTTGTREESSGGENGTGSGAAQDLVAAFGKAYVWQDGLAVTVGAPKPFKPSESAAGTEKSTRFVAFEIRVVNKTGRAWDPVTFHTSVQSNNEEADEVFDSEQLKDAPQTKVLSGREAKFTVAYGVANVQDLVMEVTPDYEHDPVLFQK